VTVPQPETKLGQFTPIFEVQKDLIFPGLGHNLRQVSADLPGAAGYGPEYRCGGHSFFPGGLPEGFCSYPPGPVIPNRILFREGRHIGDKSMRRRGEPRNHRSMNRIGIGKKDAGPPRAVMALPRKAPMFGMALMRSKIRSPTASKLMINTMG
jgi:hypothetical protein